MILGQSKASMPLYIAQSGDLDRCYRCLPYWLTDSQTLKDRATQLLTKYKSGALVTQHGWNCETQKVFKSPSQPFSTRFIIDINIINSIDIINIVNINHWRYQQRWTFLTRGLAEESHLVSDCLNHGVCQLTSHHFNRRQSESWLFSFLSNVI